VAANPLPARAKIIFDLWLMNVGPFLGAANFSGKYTSDSPFQIIVEQIWE
jgi:hypothetical protein